MIGRLNHVAIAVPDLEKAARLSTLESDRLDLGDVVASSVAWPLSPPLTVIDDALTAAIVPLIAV